MPNRSKLEGEGQGSGVHSHLLLVDGAVRQGFSVEGIWSRDLDGARSQPSCSLGKKVLAQRTARGVWGPWARAVSPPGWRAGEESGGQ